MYDYATNDNIFPSFVSSCVPQVDMESILEEVYKIKSRYESDDASNEGGYHSPRFQKLVSTPTHVKTPILSLYEVVNQFSNDILHHNELNLVVENIEYWCNINKCYNYNVMHSHGRADLIGIYYVKVPPQSGDFVVVRNDGSQYCSLYEHRNDMLEYTTEPEEGRLYILPGHLWHYVTGNNSKEDRISISFNIYT